MLIRTSARIILGALAWGFAAFGALAVCCAGSAVAGPARRDPPLLFGAGPHQVRPPVVFDPNLPTGARFSREHERPHSATAACSSRAPVCVQLEEGADGARAMGALAALETAYGRVVDALGLPAPLSDEGHGGSDALDWYLGAAPSPTAPNELVVEHDAGGLGALDRSAAYCRGGGSADALLQEREATLCVAEAIAKRFDPGETPALQRAFATEMWWLTGRISALDVELVDDAQAHPELAIAGRSAHASGAGPLFFDVLETARSAQAIGSLSASVLSSAASSTQSGAWAWNNEPDLFDVLRHSLDEETSKMAALLGEYAIGRALLGDRDDGAHAPFGEWTGSFGRARYDWVIPFSSLPRRVRASRPIDPTGLELIWVKMDEVPLGVSLGFESEWEAPVAFKWFLLSLDEQGREMARVDVPFQERGRTTQARVVKLLGVHAVLAVGVNMGGVDLAHPFDPDQDPFEAQSCTAYFVRM